MSVPLPLPPVAGELRAVRPPARPRTARTARILLAVFAVLGLIVAGLVLTATITAATGTMGFLIGLGLALLPAVAVSGALLWADRYEPEPAVLLAGVFAWGAVVAALAAALINSVTAAVLQASGASPSDALATTAVLVAPVVEETAKGAVVLGLALFLRREFDGVLDGVVFAGFAGVGFAFTENILYFGRAFLGGAQDGSGFFAVGATFVARGVLGPFAHPLFTACTGVGLGIAVGTARRAVRFGAPLLGFGAAVFLHASWNLAATGGLNGWFTTYLVLMVPVFLAALGLVTWARSRERRVIERQLPAYVATGWLDPYDVLMISSIGGRRRAREWAAARSGRAGERAMVDYQRAATELAFLRQRAARVGPDAAFAERESALLATLGRSRSAFAHHR